MEVQGIDLIKRPIKLCHEIVSFESTTVMNIWLETVGPNIPIKISLKVTNG